MPAPELTPHQHDFAPVIDLLPLASQNGQGDLADRLERFEARRCGCGTTQVAVRRRQRLTPRQERSLLSVGVELAGEGVD